MRVGGIEVVLDEMDVGSDDKSIGGMATRSNRGIDRHVGKEGVIEEWGSGVSTAKRV